ncbi:MAG: Holliday junction ATP-dependent DNA helicase RuvA [Cyanobacteria bacterium]|nr:Holliday junction ATP-dependent DNA helicase RuvA [Cyanobacteriota bacterium]
MIGWLQGQLAEPWQQANRCGALLICQGVGYELQFSPRHWRQLPQAGAELTLHIHHSIRNDGWTLYGFPLRPLGLLGAMSAEELVQAIVQADLLRLAQAPGVGKRTAERLSVELRSRLKDRFCSLVAMPESFEDLAEGDLNLPEGAGRDDVQFTLGALGYEPLEIHRALRVVAAQGLTGSDPGDDWIRECLRWLSRSAA